MKKIAKVLFGRLVIGAIVLLIQLYWLTLFIFQLGDYSYIAGSFLKIVSILAVIYIANKDENPAYKLAWVIPILMVPILGGVMYLYLGNKKPSRRLFGVLDEEFNATKHLTSQSATVMAKIREDNEAIAGQHAYITRNAGYPVYDHTQTTYYPSGEACYEEVKKALKNAKHFIFMEYFIIKEGFMLSEIIEILEQKVTEGVEVRFMYDDVGCISQIPNHFHKQLEAKGIKCMRFNVFRPIISTAWNNRDHRKILVVDGHTAFTGGFNLADEYINREARFGYWKDSGLKVYGDAAWSLTVMFLQVWNPLRKEEKEYEKYHPKHFLKERVVSDGYIQPYSDTPLDSEIVGENVYLNLVGNASRYLYLTTPYLIIDNELMTALCLAAKRGVDVRIMMPGIPDKKWIFLVSQSYYAPLVHAGVKIYEYEKGFVHAKNVVCDDKVATVGTVNWDYRSLYLHFECGVFLNQTDSIKDIYDDYIETLKDCRMITKKDCNKPLPTRVLQSILRLFAPLL